VSLFEEKKDMKISYILIIHLNYEEIYNLLDTPSKALQLGQ